MTEDRLIHGLVGIAFWILFLRLRAPELSIERKFWMLGPVLLGTWVPDWDLFLGIGFHRSPLTHSALPVILFAYYIGKEVRYWMIVGLALGIASHLFWDVKYYGNVQWISGGFADRAFLILNCAGLVLWALLKRVPSDEQGPPVKA